ncbi:hypothetical protein AVEN_107322-1 [Araneus ventricosus]|uniref:Uncharacterized protein n=1 Tax=Araneus ventricosus TaxID=182803 RepID=A0A4Y2JTU7_ARAVE|nr:hypothetical protein AVEN_107322-1 [Araneus ventricosus]
MRSRRISKRGFASLVATIMAWACPLPVIVRASYGSVRAMDGDGYCDSNLSTRAYCRLDAPGGFTPGRGDFEMNYHKKMEGFLFLSKVPSTDG